MLSSLLGRLDVFAGMGVLINAQLKVSNWNLLHANKSLCLHSVQLMAFQWKILTVMCIVHILK